MVKKLFRVFSVKIDRALENMLSIEDRLDDTMAQIKKDIEAKTNAAITYVYNSNKLRDKLTQIEASRDALYNRCKEMKAEGKDPAIIKESLKTYMSYKQMVDELKVKVEESEELVNNIKNNIVHLNSYKELCETKKYMLRQRIELMKLTENFNVTDMGTIDSDIESMFSEITEIINDKETYAKAKREINEAISQSKSSRTVTSSEEIEEAYNNL